MVRRVFLRPLKVLLKLVNTGLSSDGSNMFAPFGKTSDYQRVVWGFGVS